VGGAITGNAGTGAAASAAMGRLAGGMRLRDQRLQQISNNRPHQTRLYGELARRHGEINHSTTFAAPAMDLTAEERIMLDDLAGRLRCGFAAAGLALVLVLSSCATTVENTPEAAKAMESGGPLPPAVTGFFGSDASKLAAGPEGGAALSYVNQNVQWSKYTKIQLKPVEFWAAANSKVSASDQQMLTAYFYNKLTEDLGKNFTLVDQPGPDVLTLRVALMDATTATPGLRSISVIVPQARVLNGVQSLATGSYAFVGSAEAEMKATDATTDEMLAGAVDQRAGGIGIKGAASFQWGDAENAMDYWAQKITSRILQLQGKTSAN
jgi:hypothetical protein